MKVLVVLTIPDYAKLPEAVSEEIRKFVDMISCKAHEQQHKILMVDHERFFTDDEYQYIIKKQVVQHLIEDYTVYTNLPGAFFDFSYRYKAKIKTIYSYADNKH